MNFRRTTTIFTFALLAKRTTREGIGVTVNTTCAMLDLKVELLEQLEPTSLLANRCGRTLQPLQRSVIGPDDKPTTQ